MNGCGGDVESVVLVMLVRKWGECLRPCFLHVLL